MPQAYNGPYRRLVISFDIGTTFSGISYCILDPGSVPELRSVTRFPGQENAAGSSKIPTVLYYDRRGRVMCVGAETLLDNNVDRAETEGWQKVQLFKLRMRPSSMSLPMMPETLPPLPPSKSIVDVFADFMAYLMLCTEQFITSTHAVIADAGQQMRVGGWSDMRSHGKVTFVIAHPNGWEGAQQTKYRKAAVKAGLVPDTPQGKSRIVFVSEGEASLHYCVRAGAVDYTDGNGFVIADLGGGTLDFSAYRVMGRNPLRVEEMTASRCILQGSVFVTRRAVQHLKMKLQKSRYGADDVVEDMGKAFDETTKRLFRNVEDISLIAFGSAIDQDPAHGIRAGKLRLSGDTVATYFQPALDATISAITAQIGESTSDVYSVYLVGGFSASPYLTRMISNNLKDANISVKTPDGQTVKAVADGSIVFFLEHYVTTRIAKYSYYTLVDHKYKPNDLGHGLRKHNNFVKADGSMHIPGGITPLLQKGTYVSEEREFRRELMTVRPLTDDVSVLMIDVPVIAYAGNEPLPMWGDELTQGLSRHLCTVSADLRALRHTVPHLVNSTTGVKYQEFKLAIVLFFGGPEMRAQIVLNVNGVEQHGIAEIVYDDIVDVDDDDVEYTARELGRRL